MLINYHSTRNNLKELFFGVLSVLKIPLCTSSGNTNSNLFRAKPFSFVFLENISCWLVVMVDCREVSKEARHQFSTSYQTNAGKICKMWLVDSVTTSQSNKNCLLSSWLHLDIDYPFGAPWEEACAFGFVGENSVYTSKECSWGEYSFTYSYQAVFAKPRSLLSDPNKPVFAKQRRGQIFNFPWKYVTVQNISL